MLNLHFKQPKEFKFQVIRFDRKLIKAISWYNKIMYIEVIAVIAVTCSIIFYGESQIFSISTNAMVYIIIIIIYLV